MLSNKEIVRNWLKGHSKNEDIQKALEAGWTPPELDDAVNWWKERLMCDPKEHIETVIDDLLHVLSTAGKVTRALSFYSVAAGNFLTEKDKAPERVEARRWLEERNLSFVYRDRHFLTGKGTFPNCGRDLVFELYVNGAENIEVEPRAVPDSHNKEECASLLFVTFPDDWKIRIKLMVFIANLHVKVTLESEGPVAVRLYL